MLACVLRAAALVVERTQLLQVAAAGAACGPAGSAGVSHTIGDIRGFVGGWEGIIFYGQVCVYPSSCLFVRTSQTSMASAAPPAVATSVRDLLGLHGSWDQVIKVTIPGRGGATVTLVQDRCLPVALYEYEVVTCVQPTPTRIPHRARAVT